MRVSEQIKKRIIQRIHIDSNTKCWIWIGATSRNNPIIDENGHTHRVAHLIGQWFHNIEPNRTGRKCNNRRCVSPDHIDITSYTIRS